MPRLGIVFAALCLGAAPQQDVDTPVDFTREVQPILANHCLLCHGPDATARKADLRLDGFEGATADLGGHAALVPGKPEKSELFRRVTTADKDDLMPPAKHGKRLSPAQVEVLRRWIAQGGTYRKHWAFVKPSRPAIPAVRNGGWPKNEIDRFILARLEQAGVGPSPEADRAALVRRASIDLVGLPPSVEEVDRFLADPAPDAYERLVDRLLASPHFGERWARPWLDLARYADSQGYAEDRPRTIWAYRDWVIRALNANMPFDRFTIEQLAGDLLPEASEDQLVATGFHRNTLTNTEGGTDDEEFRNVAIVDRVNTTYQVWMGLTMACAQCHDHKYDPLSQAEFFRSFAFFNQTEDHDAPDDRPTLPLYTPDQKKRLQSLEKELAAAQAELERKAAALDGPRRTWEAAVARPTAWTVLKAGEAGEGDVRTLRAKAPTGRVTAVRLEVLPEAPKGPDARVALARVGLSVLPGASQPVKARFVRLELPGKQKMLHVAEVQVFSGGGNAAPGGKARQSSTAYDGPASLAIDGNTSGDYFGAKSTTHTAAEDNPWWEVDLGAERPVERVVVWNRTDGGEPIMSRIQGWRLVLLDGARAEVDVRKDAPVPSPSAEFRVDGARTVKFRAALAEGKSRGAELLLKNPDPKKKGWAADGPAAVVLVPERPLETPADAVLAFALESVPGAPGAAVRVSVTDDLFAAERAEQAVDVRTALAKPEAQRTADERAKAAARYRDVAPELEAPRKALESLRKEQAELKPSTTAPILRDLPAARRRKTQIHIRGNWLDRGTEVAEGVPAVLHPFPGDAPKDRLGFARWLVHPDNPLTARVVANRHWEILFGQGLVRTSEDFGVRGEPPSHPELLDWLAVELVRTNWDLKALIRRIATSATYRQSAKARPDAKDPENLLYARGPRQRLSAEQVRDQALFASGLLSLKMHGPSVYPPRPKLGLAAAFSSSTDWEDSKGEDRWRRGLYTFWRRSMPYPSMTTFDAPSAEVCTVRRIPTNTPLQALVTLNDPVYVEAAQALGRRMASEGGADVRSKVTYGFRRCLARAPRAEEVDRLAKLYEDAKARYAGDRAKATALATEPLGALPPGADPVELAAWTVVGNVLLNLDEIFLKR